jgi:biotin carboxylase
MARCLVLASKLGYQTDSFLAAARALGVGVAVGTDRCHELAKVWPDQAFAGGFDASLALDFRDPPHAADQIVEAAAAQRFDAIVPTDDATAVIAALAAARLGLPGSDPEAAYAARNKAELRQRLARAGVPTPRGFVVAEQARPEEVAASVRASIGFPAVVKPLLLSGSRGVIRVDDESGLGAALARVRAILRTRAEHADGTDLAARQILVEEFVPGGPLGEVALEGLLRRGALRTLAIYDKPDPLDGPFFEETVYVTPSRLGPEVQRAVEQRVADAAAALGLAEGPVHAELRLPPGGPVLIECANRSIGGLCARTLRFTLGGEARPFALEELVLRAALGLRDEPRREPLAAAVMMLPIPRAGVLQAVDGLDEARAVPGVEDVIVTVRVGERLVPPPEGASYLGFAFARAARPEDAEAAVREAERRLRFTVAPSV